MASLNTLGAGVVVVVVVVGEVVVEKAVLFFVEKAVPEGESVEGGGAKFPLGFNSSSSSGGPKRDTR